MTEMLELLQRAAKTGEVVTLDYSGGSRPGQPRQIVIMSCSTNDLRAYEPDAHTQKQYKIEKILWAEDSSGKRIVTECPMPEPQPSLPVFDTLQQYGDYLRNELREAGWYIHEEPNMLGVGTCFKNGKPKKTPSIAVTFFDTTMDFVWEIEADNVVEEKGNQLGENDLWRVDSWRFKQGRSFGSLYSAMGLFISEVCGSDPRLAKQMFAGHE